MIGFSARRKPATKKAAAPTPTVVTVLSHDQIARQAYALWLQQGKPQGQAQRHWQQAEAQLRAAMPQPQA